MNSKISFLLLLAFAIPVFPQNDFKVISSDFRSIVIEYTPSYSDTSVVTINNQKFIKVSVRNGFASKPEQWGIPAVPLVNLNIGVPVESGNTIQILNSSFKTLSGEIVPKPKFKKSGKLNGFEYQVSSDYYNYKPNSEIISFGEFGIMRGIPTQRFIISPVYFDPAKNSIKIYTKIVFQINYSNRQVIASKPAGNFLKGVLINFDVAKFWIKPITTDRLAKVAFNSVLSTGTWYRFDAPVEGIYKITKSMLPSYGIDPNTVDPRTIKIYNNGGKALPEDVNAPRPSDLVENAILYVGQDNGKFNDGDYILFYGRGTDFWDYDTSTKSIRRFHHPYSNHNYYWITSGGSNGKRIQPQQSLNTQNHFTQTSTKAFKDLQQDKINIGQTGREYMGDNFTPDITSRTYLTKLDGRIDNTPINYIIRFINADSSNSFLEVDDNTTRLINQYLYGYGSYEYSYGVPATFSETYIGVLPGNQSVLKFIFTPTAISSSGYLDYFEIYYQEMLQAANDNLLFFSKDTSSVIEYDLSGFSSSNIQVFNVTDYANVSLISNFVELSGGECKFQAQENAGHVSKYFAVGSGNYNTPVNPVQISNSNIHSIQPGAKFIIITDETFSDAAQRLKSYRETQAPVKISTDVVYMDQIYNEFSCGVVDPTALRDFIKYVYNNWQIKPEYVLFFGKGTYDYKDVEGYHQNFVPTYESDESFDQIYSYNTDDYFVSVDGNDQIIDLAYGRITVTNPTDANNAVDKIIQYENSSDKGTWRNLITLVSDDGWQNAYYEGDEHTYPNELLATTIIPTSFDLQKLYMAAYPVVLTSIGKTIPEGAQAIIDAINNGTLILNYIGHGSPELWAHEHIFEKSTTIPQLHNNKYFFLTAATCDFGYYDIPNYQSGAEALLLLPDAGAIGTFSSSRAVYSYDNHQLMYELFRDLLLTPRDSTNLPIPVGKAVFITKQTFNDVNSQKYEILGDPTLRLLIPEYNASIDSINGQNLSSNVQIKALSHVRVNGQVRKPDNSPWTNFTGQGILTMYDSQRQVLLAALSNFPEIVQGGVIFRGEVSITNGKFSTNFVVPKDISYENQNGKVLLYFYNNSVDGLGYTNNIIVGGTDTTAVNNKIGPGIQIFFDDTTYKNVALVNPNSTLIVKLSDSNGLNTTGTGVGHKLEGILNDQINNPIDFTNFFTGDLNSGGRSGEINYKLNNLDPGNYKLQVSAWDVFNNYSTKTTNFTVVNGQGLQIQDVYNYPDPFAGSTTFTFQQNLSQPLDVKIRIYTVAGRLIRQLEQNYVNDKFVKIFWDGRDQDGDVLANGTYFYKILVKSLDGSYSKSVLGKMAIIR
ncbi:MAG: type IX secretion system sortase PorU [Ignavibacteriaceae bacterium]